MFSQLYYLKASFHFSQDYSNIKPYFSEAGVGLRFFQEFARSLNIVEISICSN